MKQMTIIENPVVIIVSPQLADWFDKIANEVKRLHERPKVPLKPN